LKRQPGDVAARFSETCDQAAADRIDCHRKDNWNDRCHLSHGRDRATNGDNDVDLQTNKLGGNFGIALGPAFRPAILYCDVAVLDPAELAQMRDKSSRPRTKGRRICSEKANRRQLARLLRLRRGRPRRH